MASASKRSVLRSGELTCPSCVQVIERALHALAGVTHAEVFVGTGRIEVVHDPERVGTADLVAAVRAVGYRATPALV